MKSLKRSSEKLEIRKLFQKISEEDLLFHYFGYDKRIFGKSFHSPFRRDQHPSCGLFISKYGRIFFRDFARDETLTVLEMIQKKFKLKGIWETLKKINKDLSLGLIERYSPIITKEIQELIENKDTISITITKRSWEKYDLKYWRKYGITKKILKKFHVIPTKYVYIYNKLRFRNTPYCPIYSFSLKKRIKVYRPLASKKYRWRSNLKSSFLFGVEQLPKEYNTCFVVSSLKEVMTLHSLGIPAVAPQQETSRITLCRDFKSLVNPIFLFDYDSTGIEVSKKLMKKGYPCYFTGDKSTKDISDYYEKYGRKKTKELIDKILSNEENKRSHTKSSLLPGKDTPNNKK